MQTELISLDPEKQKKNRNKPNLYRKCQVLTFSATNETNQHMRCPASSTDKHLAVSYHTKRRDVHYLLKPSSSSQTPTNSQPLHDPFETRKHKKMEKKREGGGGGALERTSQIVSDPYYFLHFMAFFSYLPIRASAAPHTSHRLFDRELQAFLAFLMFSAIKV